MKSLIKKIAKFKLVTKLRDGFGIRPLIFNTNNLNENVSISDAFIWRTDNSYKTIFKYSDLLKIFFKQGTQEVEIFFYDYQNLLVKKHYVENINISNELIIDKVFLNKESYGKFFIFHKSESKLPFSIINKCYLGFSKNNKLPSFVHGNTVSSYKKFYGNEKINTNIISTSFFVNQKYKIQNFFKDFDKTELFFTNPTSKVIRFKVNNEYFYLNKGCSKIIEIKNSEKIEILSNCYFFRPIIFNYRSKFIDVHHA